MFNEVVLRWARAIGSMDTNSRDDTGNHKFESNLIWADALGLCKPYRLNHSALSVK